MHGTCMIDSNILKSLRLKISQLLGAKPSKGNILRKMHLVGSLQYLWSFRQFQVVSCTTHNITSCAQHYCFVITATLHLHGTAYIIDICNDETKK